MKAHELIEKLLKFPQDKTVTCSVWVTGDEDTYDGREELSIGDVSEEGGKIVIRGDA